MKNQNFFPQHSGISLSTVTLIFVICLALSQPSNSPSTSPSCQILIPSFTQTSPLLCRASPRVHWLTYTEQQEVLHKDNKVWFYSCFTSIHSLCFPFPLVQHVILNIFIPFSIFLFLLPFTALNFSIFFLPIPQFPLQTPLRKLNTQEISLSPPSPISSPFLLFQSLSVILSFLPLTFLTIPRDMFPQLFTDLFTCMLFGFGSFPHRSPHIFHISHHLPVFAHVPCIWDNLLYCTPPAMGTLQPVTTCS